MLIEQKQGVVADGFKVPVIRAPFLRSMHRALARIHVEHDPVGGRRHLGLREHLTVHVHQLNEILSSRQQVSLEPMSVEVSAAPRSQSFGDPMRRKVGSADTRTASLRSS